MPPSPPLLPLLSLPFPSNTILNNHVCVLYCTDLSLLSLDAEDPDLDALLADLCKLEEDTKAELATSNSNQEKQMDITLVPPR